jgi:hypothetical protein
VSNELFKFTRSSVVAAVHLYFDPWRRLAIAVSGRSDPSGLMTLARRVLVAGCAFLVAILVGAQISHVVVTQRLQSRRSELLDAIFAQTAAQAMTSSGGLRFEPTAPRSESVRILQPSKGALVAGKTLIEGTTTDPSAEIWVVVHPLDTASYWVQPRAEVRGRTWRTEGYFGRMSNEDAGKSFEVLAVIGPKVELREGQILDRWPDSLAVSDAIAVTREPISQAAQPDPAAPVTAQPTREPAASEGSQPSGAKPADGATQSVGPCETGEEATAGTGVLRINNNTGSDIIVGIEDRSCSISSGMTSMVVPVRVRQLRIRSHCGETTQTMNLQEGQVLTGTYACVTRRTP